jgi:hypothetical protein
MPKVMLENKKPRLGSKLCLLTICMMIVYSNLASVLGGEPVPTSLQHPSAVHKIDINEQAKSSFGRSSFRRDQRERLKIAMYNPS